MKPQGLIILLILYFTAAFCGLYYFITRPEPEVKHQLNVKIRHISEEVKLGLNYVTVDDTVHLMVYRGSSSCSIIQVK